MIQSSAIHSIDHCSLTCPAAARSGRLRARVVGAPWWDRTHGLDQILGHAHLQIIGPSDGSRLATLDVTSGLQPLRATHHAQMDELQLPYRRASRTLAVSIADPMAHGAVPARPTPIPAGQCPSLRGRHFDLAAAMTAYTGGSAWINRSSTGVVEPGRPADLVVLDRDPFEPAPEALWTTRVHMWMAAGS